MKTLFTLLTFFVSFQAMAIQPFFQLEEGDRALYPIKGEVTVFHQAPRCPAGAICEAVTVVQIDYSLFGCLDHKVSVNKVVNNENGDIDIYVSAFNVQNEKSLVANCIAMPMESDRIVLGLGFINPDIVKVHFLGVPENGQE